MFYKTFLKAWRDLIFPPFCVHCKQRSETKLFCPSCWELCAPPNVLEKCPHCFENAEGLCWRCKRNPLLPFPRAFVFEDIELARHLEKAETDTLSAFAIVQWCRLDWPTPDVIVPMPGNRELAVHISEMLRKPMADILHSGEGWRCDEEAILEGQIILVIDRGSPLSTLQGAISALAATFPKRGYLLSLYQL